MKFRVGDRVRQTKPYCYRESVGDRVLIIDNWVDSLWPYSAKLPNTNSLWIFSEDELELVGEYQLELVL